MPHSVADRQRGHAKELRQTQTRAETLLWRYLKAHRLEGIGFRRQVPMGAYIADFVSHSARLAVELDGATHDFEAQQKRGDARDGWSVSQGDLVLRFTNEDVLTNLAGVWEMIKETATARVCGIPPSPALPHRGGGSSPRHGRGQTT